jgi:hypothetical protein
VDIDNDLTPPRRNPPCTLAVNERKILRALHRLREVPYSDAGFPRKLVGFLSGYTNLNGGTFTDGLKKLRESGSVRNMLGGTIAMTPGGAESYCADGTVPPLPIHSNHEFHTLMKGILGSKACHKLFDVFSNL